MDEMTWKKLTTRHKLKEKFLLNFKVSFVLNPIIYKRVIINYFVFINPKFVGLF